MATLRDALRSAAECGVERLDAQLLLLHALGRPSHDRAWLLAHDDDLLASAHAQAFSALCTRRAAGEPTAYLIGQKEFHGLALHIDSRVLVPRPETETLVDWALELLTPPATNTVQSLLDLGAGSGAIALALKHARPDARVDAIDTSADALAVARANAERLGLGVRFARGNWLGGADGAYDLIVSNPPYVAAGDAHLAALRHEPIDALVSGDDGLDAIRRIVANAPLHLNPRGWLLLEHGHDQGAVVRGLLERRGFARVQSRNDLAGIARCTGGVWSSVK